MLRRFVTLNRSWVDPRLYPNVTRASLGEIKGTVLGAIFHTYMYTHTYYFSKGEEQEEAENLFKANAVNEEDP